MATSTAVTHATGGHAAAPATADAIHETTMADQATAALDDDADVHNHDDRATATDAGAAHQEQGTENEGKKSNKRDGEGERMDFQPGCTNQTKTRGKQKQPWERGDENEAKQNEDKKKRDFQPGCTSQAGTHGVGASRASGAAGKSFHPGCTTAHGANRAVSSRAGDAAKNRKTKKT